MSAFMDGLVVTGAIAFVAILVLYAGGMAIACVHFLKELRKP